MRPSPLVALALSFAGHAFARPVLVDDLMRVRTVVDVRLSPDGHRVAYVVSEASTEANEHVPVLYLVSSEGGASRRMTRATRIANRPLPRPELRWSPDGARVSFLAFVGDVPQVMAMSADGGEPEALTSSPTGVVRYEWSPASDTIAYLAPAQEPEEDSQRKKDRTYVIRGREPGLPARLFVAPASGGEARPLTPPAHFVSALDWSPDGSKLTYSASPGAEYLDQWRSKIYAVSSGGGEPVPIVDGDGMNAEPRYSPDGKHIAFLSTGGVAALISSPGLWLVDSDGGEPKSLGSGDSWIREHLWEPSGESLLFVPNEATGRRGEHMFEQPVFRIGLDGKSEVLTSGASVAFALSRSRDGKRIAYRSVAPGDAGDVKVMELDSGAEHTVTDVNPELRELDRGEQKAIHWSSFDGMEIWGLLTTPPGYRGDHRVPLVVYVHGGPIGGFTYGLFPQFMHRPGQLEPYPVEAMASAGFAVLMPMPRGGSGYGLDGFRAIVRSWGEGDYRDIMAGVDHLIAEGAADPDRLGVMGASYGGFMTNWIVTQTSRFRAASSGASICDLEDLYYLSDAGEFTEEYFGKPWDERALYDAHSPITFVDRVTTPLLLQHGEQDRRVPLMQAKKFFEALRRLGKTVELDVYPRGGHVDYEPRLERAQMERNLEWFQRWLEPKRTDR